MEPIHDRDPGDETSEPECPNCLRQPQRCQCAHQSHDGLETLGPQEWGYPGIVPLAVILAIFALWLLACVYVATQVQPQ